MSGIEMAPEWGAALLAWPAVLAEVIIFGSAMFCVIIGFRRGSRDEGDGLARTLALPWRLLAIAVFIFSPMMLLNEIAGMAGVSWPDAVPLIGEVIAKTHAGHSWAWRLPLTLALLLAAWLPMGGRRKAIALMSISAGLCLAGSLKGHAIDFGTITIACRFIHALAAGAWAGSLFGYWFGVRYAEPENRPGPAAATTLSKLATWSVVLLTLTGIEIAYEGLGGSLLHLLYSSYGRVLTVKTEVFAVVVAIGAYNRFILIPKLERTSARLMLVRNVGAESLILVAVIGLAALLAATPPARMSMTAGAAVDQAVRISPSGGVARGAAPAG